MWISQNSNLEAFELDEVFWYLSHKEKNENRSNIYIMTMLSRIPRQIVGYCVDISVNSKSIQKIADNAPYANNYYSDGNLVYCDVVFSGKYHRNVRNKKDTHNIESSNADLRHYIAGLSRRSRTFFRSKDTLDAVLWLFIQAYNKFGEAKEKYKKEVIHKSTAKHLHKYRDLPFSIIDFL